MRLAYRPGSALKMWRCRFLKGFSEIGGLLLEPARGIEAREFGYCRPRGDEGDAKDA